MRKLIGLHLAALLCLGLVVVLAGCGGGGSRPATDLTILAVNFEVGRSSFRLECLPPGGDLPDPVRACAALAAQPQLVTNPKPFGCFGGITSWWDVTIAGRLNGKPIHRAFSTCWTPQMATLGRFGMNATVLQKHLLPRRYESVLAGTKRVFAPGVLRPGDLVRCEIRGHHLSLGVPTQSGPSGSIGYSGLHGSVTLSVGRNRDGSVSASCHIGR